MSGSQSYYVRPYRGSQQHIVKDQYPADAQFWKSLCGLIPKQGWAYDYTGHGTGTYHHSDPWSLWPVCQTCTKKSGFETAGAP